MTIPDKRDRRRFDQRKNHTRGCKQSDHWAHRRYKEPINKDDAGRAVQIVLSEYDRISEFDEVAEEEYRYDQENAEIIGAWVIGSSAAGRWTRESDVDVWLQIKGLSENGYDNLDWHIKENLEEWDERIATEDGVERQIDVVILDRPPSSEYCTITVGIFS